MVCGRLFSWCLFWGIVWLGRGLLFPDLLVSGVLGCG